MDPLDAVQEGRAVLLGQQVVADLYHKVGSDPQEVTVKGHFNDSWSCSMTSSHAEASKGSSTW